MTVVATSTAATATAYSSQRKIDRCQNGVLWAMYDYQAAASTTALALRYSTDDGATWNIPTNHVTNGSGGSGNTHLPNGSLFIDLDDYAHVVFKDRVDGFLYYRRGTPNAGRTEWTWSAATSVVGAVANFNYPDVVAHREGTGWAVHIVFNFAQGTNAANKAHYARLNVTSGGVVSITQAQTALANSIGTSNSNAGWPSIDFHHTGDGKTVKDGTPHLYTAWSNGASGAGLGVRFKRVAYSGGSWTFQAEREIDSTMYVPDATGVYWVQVRFDGTAVALGAQVWDGTAAHRQMWERNAADTTTTVLHSGYRVAYWSGSFSYDVDRNLYVVGGSASGLHLAKFDRATLTMAADEFLVAKSSSQSYVSVKAGYSEGRIEFIYTDGTASPYDVVYGSIGGAAAFVGFGIPMGIS